MKCFDATQLLLSVACSNCTAPVGSWCRSTGGYPDDRFHIERFSRAFDAPRPSLPPSVDLRPQLGPAHDQGALGAGTAGAVAAAVEADPANAPRSFLYYRETPINPETGEHHPAIVSYRVTKTDTDETIEVPLEDLRRLLNRPTGRMHFTDDDDAVVVAALLASGAPAWIEQSLAFMVADDPTRWIIQRVRRRSHKKLDTRPDSR